MGYGDVRRLQDRSGEIGCVEVVVWFNVLNEEVEVVVSVICAAAEVQVACCEVADYDRAYAIEEMNYMGEIEKERFIEKAKAAPQAHTELTLEQQKIIKRYIADYSLKTPIEYRNRSMELNITKTGDTLAIRMYIQDLLDIAQFEKKAPTAFDHKRIAIQKLVLMTHLLWEIGRERRKKCLDNLKAHKTTS